MIGIGRIGWTYSVGGGRASHVSSYLGCPKTELVAVADTDGGRLEAFRKEYPGITTYEDYERMLSEAKPEIVSVATPAETHRRVVRNAARYHPVRVIFCEKPLAPTVKEAESMVRTCHYYGVRLACNLTRRWDRACWRVKRIVEGADEVWRMGDLISFSGRFSGDPVGDGVHMADLANWYGRKETAVSLLNVPSPYLVFEADLWFERGLVRILDNGSDIQLRFSEVSDRYACFMELGGITTLEETYDFRQAMLNAVDDLAVCAAGEKQPECTGEDGTKALRLVLGGSE